MLKQSVPPEAKFPRLRSILDESEEMIDYPANVKERKNIKIRVHANSAS